jgi:hypothetical protein
MSTPIFVPGANVVGVTLLMLHNVGTQEDPNWVGAPQIVNQFPRAGRAVGELDHCVPVVDAPLAQSLSRGMATQSGSVFVPKDSGVEDNMRFFYGGTWYGIIGDPRWNYLHALTGEDYGYVEFTVRKGG